MQSPLVAKYTPLPNSPLYFSGAGDLFDSSYPSIFPSPCSFSSDITFDDPDGATSADTTSILADADADADHRRELAQLALQYQHATEKYAVCVAQFREAAAEAAVLRRENAELRLANAELAERLALSEKLCRLKVSAAGPASPAVQSPRPALPKSISVRSPGFLKLSDEAKRSASLHVTNVSAPSKESGMELEVFNQGMLKTELCNKWEETGSCPYGEQCQFAHGVSELRPVIRHPRYKTEVCRMMLAGSACPYGHRCHFRHAVTAADIL